jgi:hypothetical protein
MAPRLIAAMGSQRDRYQSAADIQRYSGIAPVVASSGKLRWVHWRWACPKFLRQTFHEWALHSVADSDWAREYYDQQRAKGKRRNTAIRSLAFKWIRVLFRCWKARTPYDENVYERAEHAPPTTAGARPCGTSVEKGPWVQQNHNRRRLTENLRCLPSAQVTAS